MELAFSCFSPLLAPLPLWISLSKVFCGSERSVFHRVSSCFIVFHRVSSCFQQPGYFEKYGSIEAVGLSRCASLAAAWHRTEMKHREQLQVVHIMMSEFPPSSVVILFPSQDAVVMIDPGTQRQDDCICVEMCRFCFKRVTMIHNAHLASSHSGTPLAPQDLVLRHPAEVARLWVRDLQR